MQYLRHILSVYRCITNRWERCIKHRCRGRNYHERPTNFLKCFDLLGCDGSALSYRVRGTHVCVGGDPWINPLTHIIDSSYDVCIAYNHASGNRTGASTPSASGYVGLYSGEFDISFHSMPLDTAKKSGKAYLTNYPSNRGPEGL